MKKTIIFLTLTISILFFFEIVYSQDKLSKSWRISAQNEIQLDIEKEGVLPYSDNIEMSGKRVAGIISYTINEKGKLSIKREIFFPQLHEYKSSEDTWIHDYRAYLQDTYSDDLLPKLYINNELFVPGPVKSITINGILNIEHQPSKNGLQLSRSFFPSMDERLFVEMWTIRNTTNSEMAIVSGNTFLQFEDFGAKGKYTRQVVSNAPKEMILKSGERTSFSLKIEAKKSNEEFPSEKENITLSKRTEFLKEMAGSLQIETPDPALNTLFEFSKIRASESIFESELGLIHSPGGGRYYVGIWANDQAEYVSPFFPYLGYKIGNESAMNCYRAFAKETNPEYKNIPYSFEIEGLVKPFLKDRGDAAMIAFGAAHYAMALGDETIAKELWPLIEWCLEYCNRKLNEEGVVLSETDEMEGRIETGNANLSTSSLYYGALKLAVDLGKSIGIKKIILKKYESQSETLKSAIDKYFGANVEGLETYKYYQEHRYLRDWICLPLVVGIYNRSKATTEAILERLWTDNGVHVEKNNPAVSNIFWDRGTLYALRGTFKAGETEKSLEKLIAFSEKRLLGNRVPYAVEASPEGGMAHLSAESGLYCRIFIEGLFGLNPTGLSSFQLTPRLPKEWDKMALKEIKAFGHNFDVLVQADGEKLKVVIIENNSVLLSKKIDSGSTVSFHF